MYSYLYKDRNAHNQNYIQSKRELTGRLRQGRKLQQTHAY